MAHIAGQRHYFRFCGGLSEGAENVGASKLRKIGLALSRKPEVKKEVDAEKTYQIIMVPTLKKVTSLMAFHKKIKPVLSENSTEPHPTRPPDNRTAIIRLSGHA